LRSEEGEEIISAPNHLSLTMFARISNTKNEHLRVLIYINIRISRLHFSLRKDIFNLRNINLVSFFNCSHLYFLINVYSDDQQSVFKHLKNTEVNLNNVLIMIGDFNIKDNDWDSLYPHYSTHADSLREIVDSFNLELSTPIN